MSYWKMPAVKLRVIGQRKLIPSALNRRASHSIRCRHLPDRIPFALPGGWQVHASPSSITTQELHLANFCDIIGYQTPRKTQLRLLRDAVALFCRPSIPSDKRNPDDG